MRCQAISYRNLISGVCNFFRMPSVNVQVSQTYNSTEITRERISLIFELREKYLLFQMVFSLASAALVCAILDSASGLGTLICDDCVQILEAINLVQYFAVDSDVDVDAICVVSHQFGLLYTNFHARGCRGLTQAIHQGG